MDPHNPEADDLVSRALAGESTCWDSLIILFSERLRKLVTFRLDRRLKGRLDESDVLQEIYLEAWSHLANYQTKSAHLPFYVWLSGVARNKILELHRFHLGTKMRDAQRDVTYWTAGFADSTSALIVNSLVANEPSPSSVFALDEVRERVRMALESMDPIDREVLLLRHFEQMSPRETALALEIQEKAAAMRYVRAVRRLKQILSELSGNSSLFRI